MKFAALLFLSLSASVFSHPAFDTGPAVNDEKNSAADANDGLERTPRGSRMKKWRSGNYGDQYANNQAKNRFDRDAGEAAGKVKQEAEHLYVERGNSDDLQRTAREARMTEEERREMDLYDDWDTIKEKVARDVAAAAAEPTRRAALPVAPAVATIPPARKQVTVQVYQQPQQQGVVGANQARPDANGAVDSLVGANYPRTTTPRPKAKPVPTVSAETAPPLTPAAAAAGGQVAALQLLPNNQLQAAANGQPQQAVPLVGQALVRPLAAPATVQQQQQAGGNFAPGAGIVGQPLEESSALAGVMPVVPEAQGVVGAAADAYAVQQQAPLLAPSGQIVIPQPVLQKTARDALPRPSKTDALTESSAERRSRMARELSMWEDASTEDEDYDRKRKRAAESERKEKIVATADEGEVSLRRVRVAKRSGTADQVIDQTVKKVSRHARAAAKHHTHHKRDAQGLRRHSRATGKKRSHHGDDVEAKRTARDTAGQHGHHSDKEMMRVAREEAKTKRHRRHAHHHGHGRKRSARALTKRSHLASDSAHELVPDGKGGQRLDRSIVGHSNDQAPVQGGPFEHIYSEPGKERQARESAPHRHAPEKHRKKK